MSRKLLNINTGATMKIYSYKGKKNLCGDNIRMERLKRRITQQDLAAQLQVRGITLERDSISRIEIGTRFVTDYELKVLAEIFNVSVDTLLEEK